MSWYAKGGIFNRPSVIGVGEAGTEAVLPIKYGVIWDVIPVLSNQYLYDTSDLAIDSNGMYFLSTVPVAEFTKITDPITDGVVFSAPMADASKWACIETLEVK